MKVEIEISDEGWMDFVSFMKERDVDIDMGLENFELLREFLDWMIKNCYVSSSVKVSSVGV